MEKAAVTFKTSDNSVTGTWRGGDTIPVSTDPNFGILEITEAQYTDLAVKGLLFGDNPRWEVQGGNTLVEKADSRTRVRFVPTTVEAAVGAAAPVVTITRIDANGNVVPTNGTVTAKILGQPINVTLVNGVGSLTIPTGKPREVVIGDGPNYRVEAPLSVRIFRANALEL